MEQFKYGVTANGQPVEGFILKNGAGMEVRCIGYGCRITHVILPDGTDVVLGFDDLAGYEADDSGQGAFIGRYAGRIADAEFTIDGTRYQLEKNSGEDFLHGVLAHRVFKGEAKGDEAVTFTYTSPDGEDGFPGTLDIAVTYTLNDKNELTLDYHITTDKPTHLNVTNHTYFNLAGTTAGNLDGQALTIPSALFLEEGERLLATGRRLETAGGVFDFQSEKPILRDIGKDDPQLKAGGGYDHSFIIERAAPGLALAAVARDEASGRTLRVYTTEEDVHLYTANFLDGTMIGKCEKPLMYRSAFCLETQHYPDTPGHPEFPTTLLRPGQHFHQTTLWQFEV